MHNRKKAFFIGLLTQLLAVATLADTNSPGQTAIMQGQYGEAQAFFEKQLNNPQTKTSALAELISLHLSSGNIDTALTYADQYTQHYPASSAAFKLSGDAYCSKAQRSSMLKAIGNAKKCINFYEQAVSLDPKNTSALVSATAYHFQAPGMAGGNKQKAKQFMDMLRKLSPVQADILLLGQSFHKGELQKAEQLAAKLDSATTLSLQNQYQLAMYYRDTEQFGEARRLFSEISAQPEDYENHWFIRDSLLQLGEIYLHEGKDITKSIAFLEAYKAKNNNPYDRHYYWSTWSLAKASHAANNLQRFKQLVKQIKSEDYASNKHFAKVFKQELKALEK